jgi:general secretion pathway protein M
MSAAYRRVLALAILGLAVAGVVRLGIIPLWDTYRDAVEAEAELRDRWARYLAVAASRKQSLTAIEALEASRDVEGLAVGEPNAGRAAAALQARLGELVNAAGGRVRSIQMLPAQPEEAYYRIAARVRLTVPDEDLGSLLYGVESAAPYLFLDELDVQARRRVVANAKTPPPPLQVQMLVAAYLRAPDPATGDGG